jgi:hypothetical protein
MRSLWLFVSNAVYRNEVIVLWRRKLSVQIDRFICWLLRNTRKLAMWLTHVSNDIIWPGGWKPTPRYPEE